MPGKEARLPDGRTEEEEKKRRNQQQCIAVPPLQSPLGIPDAAAVNESRAGRRRRRCGALRQRAHFGADSLRPLSPTRIHLEIRGREGGNELRTGRGTSYRVTIQNSKNFLLT